MITTLLFFDVLTLLLQKNGSKFVIDKVPVGRVEKESGKHFLTDFWMYYTFVIINSWIHFGLKEHYRWLSKENISLRFTVSAPVWVLIKWKGLV